MKRIILDQQLCVNCGACAAVCAKRHYGAADRALSNIRPRTDAAGLYVCLQCAKKVCVDNCLKKALRTDPQTGAVIPDWDKCDGCAKCVLGCPNHAPWIEKANRKVKLCDLCGGEPACVAVCRFRAVLYAELNEYVRWKRETAAERLGAAGESPG
jgi:Fe-S-cluster-containing dehydrogenase component